MSILNIVDNLKTLIENTDKEQMLWLKIIKNTIASSEKKLAEAKDEYETWHAFIDLANSLSEAAEEMKKQSKYRHAYKDILTIILNDNSPNPVGD